MGFLKKAFSQVGPRTINDKVNSGISNAAPRGKLGRTIQAVVGRKPAPAERASTEAAQPKGLRSPFSKGLQAVVKQAKPAMPKQAGPIAKTAVSRPQLGVAIANSLRKSTKKKGM